jgi:hypothetical protein
LVPFDYRLEFKDRFLLCIRKIRRIQNEFKLGAEGIGLTGALGAGIYLFFFSLFKSPGFDLAIPEIQMTP